SGAREKEMGGLGTASKLQQLLPMGRIVLSLGSQKDDCPVEARIERKRTNQERCCRLGQVPLCPTRPKQEEMFCRLATSRDDGLLNFQELLGLLCFNKDPFKERRESNVRGILSIGALKYLRRLHIVKESRQASSTQEKISA